MNETSKRKWYQKKPFIIAAIVIALAIIGNLLSNEDGGSSKSSKSDVEFEQVSYVKFPNDAGGANRAFSMSFSCSYVDTLNTDGGYDLLMQEGRKKMWSDGRTTVVYFDCIPGISLKANMSSLIDIGNAEPKAVYWKYPNGKEELVVLYTPKN